MNIKKTFKGQNICYIFLSLYELFRELFQFRIFTAPFHHVGFADFWLADQLNSLTTALLDFEYLICYYSFEVDWIGLDSKCTPVV